MSARDPLHVVGASKSLTCRNCGFSLRVTFADLGVSPLSNSYVPRDRAREMEPFYPLHAFVCERCLLVQVEAFETPDRIFSNYAYFSSYSDSWLDHSCRYVDRALQRLGLGSTSLVVEAASNDGYLLRFFLERGVKVLGIEPAANVAAVARERAIPTEIVFLGRDSGQALRDMHGVAELVVANNVIAHVPDLHDFIAGLEVLMAPAGTLTVEIPHIQNLIESVQFDTIYHEHFSYYSLHSMERVLAAHGLRIWDVEKIPTHGGSLRFWIVRDGDSRLVESRVQQLRDEERQRGLTTLPIYQGFQKKVAERKREILRFFIEAAEGGRTVAGYGAPAKGNTLLNYCGIRGDMMPFTVDRNPEKQGTLLPGTRIPVLAPEVYRERKPDYVMILPWNIRDEVVSQTAYIREWGGRFVVAMPELEVF
jgi:SAM-dependent methyltransferase